MRKKSCFLSMHVPFVLKPDDVTVTSPSWLPNQFSRHSTGNEQYPSANTATSVSGNKWHIGLHHIHQWLHINNNNNIHICIAPYGRNFRGAGILVFSSSLYSCVRVLRRSAIQRNRRSPWLQTTDSWISHAFIYIYLVIYSPAIYLSSQFSENLIGISARYSMLKI